MNKVLFREEQQFRQWWSIILILGATIPVIVQCIYALYQQTILGIQVGNSPAPIGVSIIVLVFLCIMLWGYFKLKLEVWIDQDGIHYRFFPLIFRNNLISKEEIQRYEIRKYKPIIDYGGWGVRRGFGRKWQKAYNVSGNIGLQLYMTNGKRVLFGTQRSQAILYAMDEMMKLNQKPENTRIMKIHNIAFLIGFFVALAAFGQTEETITLKTGTGDIEGTLTMPETKLPVPVALIIAGSGPTDRDGNNPVMKNNSLKMLSAALAKKGIATLRYDKRGIAKSQQATLKETDLRFENYIQDAVNWVQLLKKNEKFSTIVVIGHSEGSLIGMVASQNENVDRFVSIAGAGQAADQIIREQLKAQPAFVLEQSTPILDELVKGNTVENVPQMLFSLFRPSVQPYMISWFKYDPQVEISKLNKPILIVQGTTDIQVSVEDAKRLQVAKPGSKFVVIEGMNHIFKNVEADRTKNIQTYNQPDLPIDLELSEAISSFILVK